jgi:hypothetical protein
MAGEQETTFYISQQLEPCSKGSNCRGLMLEPEPGERTWSRNAKSRYHRQCARFSHYDGYGVGWEAVKSEQQGFLKG